MNMQNLTDEARERCISNLSALILGSMQRYESGCKESRSQAEGYDRARSQLIRSRSAKQVDRMEKALGLLA